MEWSGKIQDFKKFERRHKTKSKGPISAAEFGKLIEDLRAKSFNLNSEIDLHHL